MRTYIHLIHHILCSVLFLFIIHQNQSEKKQFHVKMLCVYRKIYLKKGALFIFLLG